MSKLAIVIPYYKLNFFEETLRSVANQNNKNFTLYIGNDASPDDPLPLIRKYFPDEVYNYYNYKTNLGGENLALQWERILENINEEWFQILGDDDTISENFVEEFYDNLKFVERNKSNVIKIKQCWINENGFRITENSNYTKILPVKFAWRKKHFENYKSSLSEHIFRTSTYKIKRFRQLPLAWYSDDLAVLDFSSDGPIIFIDNALVNIRISTINISSREDNICEKNIAKCYYLEIMINEYSQYFTKDELKKTFENYLYNIWHNNMVSNLKFAKLYLKIKPFYKVLGLPLLKYNLKKNARRK